MDVALRPKPTQSRCPVARNPVGRGPIRIRRTIRSECGIGRMRRIGRMEPVLPILQFLPIPIAPYSLPAFFEAGLVSDLVSDFVSLFVSDEDDEPVSLDELFVLFEEDE